MEGSFVIMDGEIPSSGIEILGSSQSSDFLKQSNLGVSLPNLQEFSCEVAGLKKSVGCCDRLVAVAAIFRV